MALLDVPATKSALLALKSQLAFAEEGYALLDRKRELLLLETQARRGAAAAARRGAEAGLRAAYAALKEALLDAGSAAVDGAALGAAAAGKVKLAERRLMGVRLPEASCAPAAAVPAFGPGSPAAAALARRLFLGALPALAGLAGMETALRRLERELRKTQRRCNALSKKLIPDCRETILFLGSSLEEREREAAVAMKMIRDRLRPGSGPFLE